MGTTVRQIDLWRQSRSEHQRLEFKEAKRQFDNHKLYQYCVALANEGGGCLLLGVANKPPRRVVGSKAIDDPIGMTEKVFECLGFRVEIEEVEHPDGRVVVIQVPSRPRGTAYHLNGQYLMRSGQQLVPMSEDRLRAIFSEGGLNWGQHAAADGLDVQEVVELLDVQTFFELLNLPFPADRSGVIDRLLQERLIDRTGDEYSIRRLGALLLARRLSDFPDVAPKAPRVVVYSDKSKLRTRIDQDGKKGYAVGFAGLVDFIMSQLPQNELFKDALRDEFKLVPGVAIRELAANALIHQELTMVGASVMIEVYSDRVEMTNPGEPIVPIERFIDGYQSRNERLANIMRRLRICEEKSSGIDRVVAAAEAYQLPAPIFQVVHRRTAVTIFGPRPFEEMNREDRIRACYQHCVLRWVMKQQMTNQSLRKRFHLPENKNATVSQVIAATIDAGLIKLDERVGKSRRLARYLPIWA